MTALLARLASHFVDPCPLAVGAAGAAGEQDPRGQALKRRSAADTAVPAHIALVCQPRDASALGCAIALGLVAMTRAGSAVVCLWAPGPFAAAPLRAPALPAARRLASRLAADGHDVSTRGRLAVVRLPAVPAQASTAVAALASAAPSVHRVVVLAGPADGAFDDAITAMDLVLVAAPTGAATALGRLAIAGLSEVATSARELDVPITPAARLVARAGLLLPAATRAAVTAALTERERGRVPEE